MTIFNKNFGKSGASTIQEQAQVIHQQREAKQTQDFLKEYAELCKKHNRTFTPTIQLQLVKAYEKADNQPPSNPTDTKKPFGCFLFI